METVSLLKYLVEAGMGARRRVVAMIKLGRIAVNGKTAESYTMPVYATLDTITCDGKPIKFKPAGKLVLMLNKPAGILCTTSDDRDRKTVMDLLPAEFLVSGLHPVGRLDYDTTGLILLTNDGNLTYRLTHPRFEHEKEYLVSLEGSLTTMDKEKLEKGIMLEDGMTHPAIVQDVKVDPRFNYSITIHEGRNKQVKRMFASLGHEVRALKRVRMGNLMLGNLAEGKARELSQADLKALLEWRR